MEKMMNILRSYWKEKLDLLNIVELRKVAKDLSMSSPTSIEKDDLVEDILMFLGGNTAGFENLEAQPLLEDCDKVAIDPKVMISGCFKEKDEYSAIKLFNASRKDNPEEEPLDYFAEDVSFRMPKQMVASSTNDVYEDNEVYFVYNRGYFLEEDEKYLLIFDNGKRQIQVSEFQVKYYNLKNYDSVMFKSMRSKAFKEEYIVDILEINGLETNKRFVQHTDFSELGVAQQSVAFDFDGVLENNLVHQINSNGNLSCGARVVIFGKGLQATKKLAKDLVQAFSVDKSVGVFPILIDYSNEASESFAELEPNTFVAKFGVNAEKNLQGVLLAFSRAKRFVEEGRRAVVVIDSINGLSEILEEVGGDYFARSVALKLFNMGANFDNGGSLTIIAFAGGCDRKLEMKLRSTATMEIEESALEDGTQIFKCLNCKKEDFLEKDENVLEEVFDKTIKAEKKNRSKKQELQKKITSAEVLKLVKNFYEE